MNLSKIAKGLLLGPALLIATSAWAGSKDVLKVSEPVTINGMKLNVGDYQLKWEGTGPAVELMIIKSHKVVVTVPARFVELSRPGDKSTYVTRMAEDGTVSLSEIRFPGKKYLLAIGPEAGATEAAKEGGQQ
ncbi:MAG TPA: hypothetical protein VKH15_18385 [Candidatus Acidoferrum sp.]|nr:hypothetical protein [Candidatus Acidoferrum sp.]